MDLDITIKEWKEFRCPECGCKMDLGDSDGDAFCNYGRK